MIRQRFEDLVGREYPRLMAIATKWGAGRAGVSEVTIVDAVLQKFRSRKIYKRLRANDQEVLGYLAVCVTNQTMDARRRTKGTYENLGMFTDTITGAPDSYADYAARQNYKWGYKKGTAVEEALAKLSDVERLVAERIFMYGETYQDLAEETGKSMSTLRRAGASCKKKLLTLMSSHS